MTDLEIREEIRSFVCDHFPLARRFELTETSPLLTSGIVDSMGILELVTFLEDRFELFLEDDDVIGDHFESIESLTRLTSRKLQLAGAS